MQQINAFEILGSTPSDNLERLQELLDEKELLSEDPSAAQNAYSELTNPKKRIIHEILYIRSNVFNDFNKLVLNGIEITQTDKIATTFVNMGHWFEANNQLLFFEINGLRKKSGFKPIEEKSILFQAIDSLRSYYIQSANNYLDTLKEQVVVSIFNKIVKITDYKSIFIDELLAHYELIIKETVKKAEEKCLSDFEEIKTRCDSFNSGDFFFGGHSLSFDLQEKISHFGKSLKKWDNYVQPMQVNMQKNGGEHEDSLKLVLEIRSQTIDLCNRSQKSLNKTLEIAFGSGSHNAALSLAVSSIPEYISDSVRFFSCLILLTDILIDTFAELEMVTEKLREDRETLISIKSTVSNLDQQVQTAKTQVQKSQSYPAVRNTFSSSNSSECGCYIATCVYGSYDCPQVWTLRRFRDSTLGSTWYGRAFIRIYYAISPTLVRWFGKTIWFKKIWKGTLDRMVKRLNDKGVQDTPYQDREWK